MYACFVVTVVARAAVKRQNADAGDAVWNGDKGKTGATGKRTFADAGDVVWNADRGKRAATVKRLFADAGDAVWNGDRGKRGATEKRLKADAGDVVWNGNRVKRGAKGKRTIGNDGDVVWDDDVPVLVWLNPTVRVSADERNDEQGDKENLKAAGFHHDGVGFCVEASTVYAR